MASYSKMLVYIEWPFREKKNGAERIYTALVKVGFCHFKCVLTKVIDRSNWAVSSKNNDRIDAFIVNKKKSTTTN